MNYVNGKIISVEECDAILENIGAMIAHTMCKPPLDIDIVIDACDRMSKNIGNLGVLKRLPELGVSPELARMYIGQIERMFSADAIRKRLRIELGADYDKPRQLVGMGGASTATQSIAPLGALFHITAGNVDGLPFVSLLDGLLTGNINIVKLPKEEGGITVSLLSELFEIEPALKEYVYVFDYSSKDAHAMKTLAAASDAIVVWGGDEAVSAVRAMAGPNTKLIEWGHKISFAYVTEGGINTSAMAKLAHNICATNQLLCSSCQGVFLDTDDMRTVYDFCEFFLPILEEASLANPFAFDAGEELFVQAKITLDIYHQGIENRDSAYRVFRGKGCSVSAYPDSKLETSIMYRNVWVKPLAKDDILNLRPYKGYLQTAALICADSEYDDLSRRLLQTGVVKISDGSEMSNYAFGEAHDGMFPLRCYTRLVSVQDNKA